MPVSSRKRFPKLLRNLERAMGIENIDSIGLKYLAVTSSAAK